MLAELQQSLLNNPPANAGMQPASVCNLLISNVCQVGTCISEHATFEKSAMLQQAARIRHNRISIRPDYEFTLKASSQAIAQVQNRQKLLLSTDSSRLQYYAANFWQQDSLLEHTPHFGDCRGS